jgi:hypothetical protein
VLLVCLDAMEGNQPLPSMWPCVDGLLRCDGREPIERKKRGRRLAHGAVAAWTSGRGGGARDCWRWKTRLLEWSDATDDSLKLISLRRSSSRPSVHRPCTRSHPAGGSLFR